MQFCSTFWSEPDSKNGRISGQPEQDIQYIPISCTHCSACSIQENIPTRSSVYLCWIFSRSDFVTIFPTNNVNTFVSQPITYQMFRSVPENISTPLQTSQVPLITQLLYTATHIWVSHPLMSFLYLWCTKKTGSMGNLHLSSTAVLMTSYNKS